MQTVTITQRILSGNLFSECGYDEHASSENLAQMTEQAYRSEAAAIWPGAAIKVNITTQRASGCGGEIEIEGIEDDGDPVLLTDEYLPIFERIAEQGESVGDAIRRNFRHRFGKATQKRWLD